MSEEEIQFTTNDDYLFKTPLYTHLKATKDELYSLRMENLLVDGYCPECQQLRTFSHTRQHYSHDWWIHFNHETEASDEIIDLQCARFKEHKIRILSRISDGGVQKIGQYPSFADIALDESKSFTKLLSKDDAAEFHKAVGLAAHNVGIGSYVYLRRIFERLIFNRFNEYATQEKWDLKAFTDMRMAERIAFLKNHLPPFMVTNARLYSILSLGVHQLDEKDCLRFFPVLRQSIVWILEQDKKKKEELEQQIALTQAIAGFSAKPSSKDISKK